MKSILATASEFYKGPFDILATLPVTPDDSFGCAFLQAQIAAEDGEPGMVLAQVGELEPAEGDDDDICDARLRGLFIPHSIALQIKALIEQAHREQRAAGGW